MCRCPNCAAALLQMFIVKYRREWLFFAGTGHCWLLCCDLMGAFALLASEHPECSLIPSGVTVPLHHPCLLLRRPLITWHILCNLLWSAADDRCPLHRRVDQPLFVHLQEVFPMESDPAEHLRK